MIKKVGEIYEEDGRYFMQVFKDDPIEPCIKLQVQIESTNGNSFLTKFLIPGEDLYKFSQQLENFIKSLGGSKPNDYEMFLIESPFKGV